MPEQSLRFVTAAFCRGTRVDLGPHSRNNKLTPSPLGLNLSPSPSTLPVQRGGKDWASTGSPVPCFPSWERLATSSRQSEGNQPTRPLTWPSQKPPSPMLSTGWGAGTWKHFSAIRGVPAPAHPLVRNLPWIPPPARGAAPDPGGELGWLEGQHPDTPRLWVRSPVRAHGMINQ